MTERLKIAIERFERTIIVDILDRYNWDKIKTAKYLGISLSSLYRKIKELKIERKQK